MSIETVKRDGLQTLEESIENSWRRELTINLLGVATLAAVVLLGSYALRVDAAPIASTSVKAFAAANGLEYTELATRYDYPRVLTGGGSGGNGSFRTEVAAQQK